MSDERPEVAVLTCALCGETLAAEDAVSVNNGCSWGCQRCKEAETTSA